MDPLDPRHGTYAGYCAHPSGDACRPCRDAAARYEAGRYVDAILGRRRTVPSRGTARRVQALVALGWTFSDLARQVGYSHDQLRKWAHQTDTMILASSAATVDALYRRLCMTPAPHATRTQKRNVGYARAVARRHGWVTALAWDDDTIDDPEAEPSDPYKPHAWSVPAGGKFIILPPEPVDEVAVQRILDGDWRLPCTKADKVAVVARWAGHLNELSRLTGWKSERYVTREDGAA